VGEGALLVGPAGVRTAGLVSVEGDVLVTALKGAEDGDGAILRVVAGPAEAGTITPIMVHAVGQVTRARLDETPEEGLPFEPLRPSEIRTLRLRPD
jgi:alpha-mannosidase